MSNFAANAWVWSVLFSIALQCGAVPCYRGRGQNATEACIATQRAKFLARPAACTYTKDTDYDGASWGSTQSSVYSASACCSACAANSKCAVAVWQKSTSHCYLKGGPVTPISKSGVEACVHRVRPSTPQPAPPSGNTVLSFDLSNTTHALEGFGAQVWADQHFGYDDFKSLNIKYIRTTQDSATMAQMQELRKVTDALGIKWIYVLWSAPSSYVSGSNMLTDVKGFATHWITVIKDLDAGGVRPHYIDLMNEPNSRGEWSTGISPSDFNTLVKEVRAGLDVAGYKDIGITGPGLAALDYFGDSQKWISALDATAVRAISAWASHMWDDGAICHGGSSCTRAAWAKGFGPAIAESHGGASKRAWVTEFATKEVILHGTTYPLPDDTAGYSSASSMAYAARVYQNTIALLGAGASAAFYWEAEDEPHKSWGWVTRNGQQKPVLQTLSALLPKLPCGSRVVAPPPPRPEGEEGIAAGVFTVKETGTVIVAIANDAAETQSATIELRGASPTVSVLEATAVLIDKRGSVDKKVMDTAKTESRTVPLTPMDGAVSLRVDLPGDSTLTIILQ